MDTKALAKSKRAHSRKLNRRHNSNLDSRPHPSPSGDAGNPCKAAQKLPQRHYGAVPGLPSNWDRHEDEEQHELIEGALAVSAGTSTSNTCSSSGKVKVSDVPVPKSKGADYRYLLEEANLQSQYRYSDALLSVDETLPEFFQEAASSLISIRGEAILSWCNDDKFAIEDESCPVPEVIRFASVLTVYLERELWIENQSAFCCVVAALKCLHSGAISEPAEATEVPFLSLNLNKLEEQLAKVDLAKRLFIDTDLLPPEWLSTSLSLDDLTEEEAEDKNARPSSSSQWLPASSLNQVDSSTSQTYRSGTAAAPVHSPKPTEVPSLDERGNRTLFEAGAAEAELDELLDSFGDTKLVNPSTSGSRTSYLPVRQQSHLPLPQMSSQGLNSSGAMNNNDIDTFLDDLLEETSMPPSNHAKNNLSLPKQGKVAALSPLPVKTSKSNSTMLNDFDSWLDTI